jgi:hypothetical protein
MIVTNYRLTRNKIYQLGPYMRHMLEFGVKCVRLEDI